MLILTPLCGVIKVSEMFNRSVKSALSCDNLGVRPGKAAPHRQSIVCGYLLFLRCENDLPKPQKQTRADHSFQLSNNCLDGLPCDLLHKCLFDFCRIICRHRQWVLHIASVGRGHPGEERICFGFGLARRPMKVQGFMQQIVCARALVCVQSQMDTFGCGAGHCPPMAVRSTAPESKCSLSTKKYSMAPNKRCITHVVGVNAMPLKEKKAMQLHISAIPPRTPAHGHSGQQYASAVSLTHSVVSRAHKSSGCGKEAKMVPPSASASTVCR